MIVAGINGKGLEELLGEALGLKVTGLNVELEMSDAPKTTLQIGILVLQRSLERNNSLKEIS